MNKGYSVRMTGAGFLLHELKVVSKLKLSGVSLNNIKARVFHNNLFQYNKIASIQKVYPFIIRRCEVLPNELLELLQTETVKNIKMLNLLSIMEDDMLFKDFMIETVGVCYKNNDLLFGKVNVNRYFCDKAEQNETVAAFKDSTMNKLRQLYLKILVESELLSGIKNGELRRVFLDNYLKDKLIDLGYVYYVNILEGN